MSPAASARWCPTPEQLMILEEMYRAGVRTPSASQIQQITAHLSLYGKIEGKNVFYWFQNHKARDRQKLRRKLNKQLQQQQDQQHQSQQQLFQLHPSPNCGFCHSYLDHHQCQASAFAFRQLSYCSPPPPPCPPLPPFPSVSYPPQGGNIIGGGSWSMTDSNSWSEIVGDVPKKVEMEKSTMKMYNGDWMMVLDMDPSEFCPAKPLKTLELFPTTSTNLREDGKNSTVEPV